MQILLANAKIMFGKTDRKPLSTPLFQTTADMLAAEMAKMNMEDLAHQLDCSKKIATENWIRYQNFVVAEKMPALLAYNGQAYKHLRAATLSEEALEYAQKHLWITCFLYGLLRPMDAVVPYRMEHYVSLETTNDKPINHFWRDKLTDVLIASVQADEHSPASLYRGIRTSFRLEKGVQGSDGCSASLLHTTKRRQFEDAGGMGKIMSWSYGTLYSEQSSRHSRGT